MIGFSPSVSEDVEYDNNSLSPKPEICDDVNFENSPINLEPNVDAEIESQNGSLVQQDITDELPKLDVHQNVKI